MVDYEPIKKDIERSTRKVFAGEPIYADGSTIRDMKDYIRAYAESAFPDYKVGEVIVEAKDGEVVAHLSMQPRQTVINITIGKVYIP